MNSIRLCSVDECDRRHYGLGLCKTHHARFTRHGSTDKPQRPIAPKVDPLAYIEQHTEWSGECLEWAPDRRDRDGYGRVGVRTFPTRAHRLAYETYTGAPIPDGLVVRHRCDNPPCVRREHLHLGTNADNQRDKVERRRSTFGTRNPSVKLTPEAVGEIRQRAPHERHGDLAREFGVGQSQIGRIVRGESWAV